MCFGVPMRIMETNGLTAICEGSGRREHVDLALVGPSTEGTYVLVHLGSAHRILSPQEANQIASAISAVSAAADGQPFEHLIADLADREPTLPPHLQSITTPEKIK